MQAAGLVVDRVETGGLARKPPARIHRRLDDFQRAEGSLAEGLRFIARTGTLGHTVEIGFGLLDLAQRLDLVGGVERAFDEIAPDADQFAQQRKVVDLFGQLARVEQALPVGGQLREIGHPAQLLERFVGFEIGPQRDRRGDRIAIEQPQDALVDALVHRLVEMLRHQRRGQFLDHLVVDQHRAEERGFGFEVGGQHGALRRFRGSRIVGGDKKVGIGHRALMRFAVHG